MVECGRAAVLRKKLRRRQVIEFFQKLPRRGSASKLRASHHWDASFQLSGTSCSAAAAAGEAVCRAEQE